MGDRSADGGWPARVSDPRQFRHLVQALLAVLKEKREVPLDALAGLLGGDPQARRRRPFLAKRINLALKILSFLGCVRVARNQRRQKSAVFLSPMNVRNAIIGFLQNAQYTSKVDKRELKEKLELIFLKSEAERFIDRKRILKENGALFKPRTPSFDLYAVDKFLQRNQTIVVPNTPIVLKRDLHPKDVARN